jgi:hypothetical protein
MADTWLVEVYLGLYTVLWGLWFANPLIDSFGVTGSSYALLRHFPGGETAFGLVVAVLGGAKLLIALRGTRRQRCLMACVMGAFWGLIAMAIAIPTVLAAAGIPHFALAGLANWFVWVRLAQLPQPMGGRDR